MSLDPTRARRVACLIAAGAMLIAAGAMLAACGTSVLDVEAGQCVNTELGTEVSNLPVVDCAEPHTGEIYALPQLADGDFPGNEAITTMGDQLCTGQPFQDYVGVPYAQSEIFFAKLNPSPETWAEGDREVVCILTQQDRSATTGSLRGANR